MEPVAQSPWRLEFARRAAITRELEKRLRDELHMQEKREREKEQETCAEEQTDILAMVEIVLATDRQIAELRVKVDYYDGVAVEALLANEADLQAIRQQIREAWLDAYMLPDGRRVFKNRDGTQVFDESGAEISPEEVDPDAIADDKIRWEDWLDMNAREAELVEERNELIEFQDKVAEVREKLDDPALTANEAAALAAELEDAAPARVQAIVDRNADTPKQDRAQEAAPGYVADQQRFQTAAKLDIAAP